MGQRTPRTVRGEGGSLNCVDLTPSHYAAARNFAWSDVDRILLGLVTHAHGAEVLTEERDHRTAYTAHLMSGPRAMTSGELDALDAPAEFAGDEGTYWVPHTTSPPVCQIEPR